MFRRIVVAVLVLGAAAAAAVAVWPQFFGVQRLPIAAQLVSLRGLAIACAVVVITGLVVVALIFRRGRGLLTLLALILAAFVVASASILAHRGVGDTTFEPRGAGDITVLSWNTLGDAPGSHAIAKLALATGADIVSLPETTRETATEVAELMRAGGRPMWAHTFHYDLISKARSTSLLTSVTLGEYHVDTDHRTTNVLPTVVATPVDGTGPTIIAVHTVAPIPSELNRWKLDLTWLSRACSGTNVIMAGDFNSTLDHFQGLATRDGAAIGNCFDAGAETGNAAVGTWPTALPALLGAPIDHVMATREWRVTGMRVIGSEDRAGSDHRPIVVQLSPRG
ncbi:endonuclease/exonuclease/phosphatase (EEP) superfamily protein YafD [Cryobacterium mesophilum]|uniref:Endonuclease/exonuclease/phosphatase family protein n=1 Tax=Terrimesophilobacter mesophilus TaxID=433647 RepID=A0A4R8VFB4_9MICO|nr:endonuclease/exonuclease/phosphatase family protein [Terrimesophilobacter mesophilus]MBB5633850.1 endonuclease/exonuclease/phosphatase (EEP) superfamily protein YafD [Terrimesophilobacter mesophilus]TFB80527.1 endonuclease/exonuclease/phosphatase family protein [Terrimesophilobacter mesophilus]